MIHYGLSGKAGPPTNAPPELMTPEAIAERQAAAQAALLRRFHDLWDALHDLADPTPEKLDRITAMLPCGDCKTHFVELLKELPPVYDSLAGYRYRSWEWHDRIDAKLGKFRPTFADVARARNWPTP